MKRYVREFANDLILRERTIPKKHTFLRLNEEKINKINNVVKYCEQGYISNVEAMKSLVKIEMGE